MVFNFCLFFFMIVIRIVNVSKINSENKNKLNYCLTQLRNSFDDLSIFDFCLKDAVFISGHIIMLTDIYLFFLYFKKRT